MEKLYEKVDKLKACLNETTCVIEIKRLLKEINEDKELIEMIEEYNKTEDERIRNKILNNQLFREYKHQEAELNLLILQINQRLRKIIKRDKCGL